MIVGKLTSQILVGKDHGPKNYKQLFNEVLTQRMH